MFGSYIKELRGNDSIREASRNIGISHTYLDSIEKGFDARTLKEREMSFKTVKKIAEYYNIVYIEALIMANMLTNKDVNEYINSVEGNK